MSGLLDIEQQQLWEQAVFFTIQICLIFMKKGRMADCQNFDSSHDIFQKKNLIFLAFFQTLFFLNSRLPYFIIGLFMKALD